MQELEPTKPGLPASRLSGFLKEARMAHELSNLIQIASSAVNIIARSSRFDVAPTLEPVISGAKDSLERAGILLRQSLRRTARETSKVKRVDVEQCLTEIIDLIQPTWAPQHRIALHLATALPPVECAPLELQSAILNLALNARDSMPYGGKIMITAAESISAGGKTLIELRVEDHGIGMTGDTMKRACDPFFTTKSDGLGGFGLPMVKRFVEDLGGWIRLASVPGEGTTATLFLPTIHR